MKRKDDTILRATERSVHLNFHRQLLSKARTNNLYAWIGHKNVGDELSFYLVEKITGKKFLLKEPPFQTKTLIAIGSLLTTKTLSSNSIIWGAGTLLPLSRPYLRHRISRFFRQIKTLSFFKPDVRAVRGPKTREVLLEMGIPCPENYGDPAILLPRYYKPKVDDARRYKAGLILHHIQSLKIPRDSLKALGILPISILRESSEEIEQFIDEIVSCEKIFSSSLHGIILAQAYGIPAQWIQIENQPILNDSPHKFLDYFLGAGQIVQAPLKLNLSLDALQESLRFTPPRIKSTVVADTLLRSFPFDEIS